MERAVKGGAGQPVGLLCSRNARPKKALVGRAQWETKQAALAEKEKQARKDGKREAGIY